MRGRLRSARGSLPARRGGRARRQVIVSVLSDPRIEGIPKEPIRFEEITRSQASLKVSAAYDGMMIDL